MASSVNTATPAPRLQIHDQLTQVIAYLGGKTGLGQNSRGNKRIATLRRQDKRALGKIIVLSVQELRVRLSTEILRHLGSGASGKALSGDFG